MSDSFRMMLCLFNSASNPPGANPPKSGLPAFPSPAGPPSSVAVLLSSRDFGSRAEIHFGKFLFTDRNQ